MFHFIVSDSDFKKWNANQLYLNNGSCIANQDRSVMIIDQVETLLSVEILSSKDC